MASVPLPSLGPQAGEEVLAAYCGPFQGKRPLPIKSTIGLSADPARDFFEFLTASGTWQKFGGEQIALTVAALEENAKQYRIEMPKTMIYSSSTNRQYLFVIPDKEVAGTQAGEGRTSRGGLLVDLVSGEQFVVRRVRIHTMQRHADSYHAAPAERVPYLSSQPIPPYRPNMEYVFSTL